MFHPFSIFANVVRDKSWILGLRQRWTACAVQTCSTHLCRLTFFVVSKIYSVFFISSGSKWKHPPFGVSTEQYSGKHRSRTCVSIQRKGFHFKAWRFKTVFWGFVSAMFHHCTPKSPTGRPCFILTALWWSCEPGDLPGISEKNQLPWKKSPVSLQKWWVSPGESNFDIFESMLIPLRYKPLLSVFWRLCRVFWGIKIRSWCGLELELRINHASCWTWLS